jgi:hypothetical protein
MSKKKPARSPNGGSDTPLEPVQLTDEQQAELDRWQRAREALNTEKLTTAAANGRRLKEWRDSIHVQKKAG